MQKASCTCLAKVPELEFRKNWDSTSLVEAIASETCRKSVCFDETQEAKVIWLRLKREQCLLSVF